MFEMVKNIHGSLMTKDIDIETQDFDVIASLLLYLVESITFEDKFIDALNNGYLIRLIKRLEYLN